MEQEQETFRVDIQGVRESKWSSNGKVYLTKEEAESAAKDLYSRWSGMESWRVVPTSTPKNELVQPEDRRR